MPPASKLEAAGTVARALAVLRVIAEAGGEVGVKQVSDALGLPMSTAHRLLDLLGAEGYIEKDSARHRYRVGLEWFRVSSLVLSRNAMASAAAPILAELTRETGETALLSLHQPATGKMIFAAKSDSPQPLRYNIQMFVPLSLVWGASGLAILAFLGPKDQKLALERAEPLSASGAPFDEAALRQRLTEIAARGYALSEGEKLTGAVMVATPVREAGGQVVGSIGVTIPSIRFVAARAEIYAASLRAAATKLMAQSNLAKRDKSR